MTCTLMRSDSLFNRFVGTNIDTSHGWPRIQEPTSHFVNGLFGGCFVDPWAHGPQHTTDGCQALRFNLKPCATNLMSFYISPFPHAFNTCPTFAQRVPQNSDQRVDHVQRRNSKIILVLGHGLFPIIHDDQKKTCPMRREEDKSSPG